MGIFKSHYIPPICHLIQPVEVAVSKSTYGGGQHEFQNFAHYVRPATRMISGTGISFGLTQFLLGKNKESVVLVQILVKLDGEITNEL